MGEKKGKLRGNVTGSSWEGGSSAGGSPYFQVDSTIRFRRGSGGGGGGGA